MMLDDMDILIPVIDILLPVINTRLNPPVQLPLVEDNSCWVLAFVGAFCAAIRLVEVTTHADSVKEITFKMIDSVRELVERGGMEVGVIRQGSAFEALRNQSHENGKQDGVVENRCDRGEGCA
ncbi:hypothetical protein DY000_02010669 [Brassica cretica]|uniref:DUF577 domain-containing protein n=2 Tax=Brassica cretica TaxID=69181 RepID=A0ABQ7BW30_BRACR|nr:hypothetical protein DY000_02010669 [Brassica cretica]